ncbi:ChaN family lipoprotein [Pedobacter boryungensis]|uniref:ChaN family lipoprotein n=1 Tax=Pedobacter boryungensis TaxID=869962 RepID=A0ABX2DAU2_9SPHI|nr:ChaN family lipoprotein [Pedobacter boryungensis]NQX31188.1 ChaN family lipoprotein [Pedobacter boryungensis]
MKRLFSIAILLLPLFASAQDMSKHYKIYDVKKQKIVTVDDIVTDLGNANVLFFGEEHNDSTGHYLEATLFKKIAMAYPGNATLTMEMFHTDVQPVINEYLKGIISEKNFIKEARAWNNYQDYKPMIELAKLNNLDVIGGNAAARYSNVVTRSGLEILNKLPQGSKQFIAPLPIDTATGRYYDKFIETLGGHNMGGMKVYQTQNFWDATMAWSIAKYAKSNVSKKIFQVNGRFHSDEKLGTLAQLKKYAPKLKILNISSFSAEDFDQPDWSKYKDLGDYIIVTDPKLKRTF